MQEVEYVTVQAIHAKQVDVRKKLGIVAHITQWPEGDADTDTKMNIVVVDDTGVIQTTAWGGPKICGELRALMPAEDAEEDKAVRVKLEGLTVRDSGTKNDSGASVLVARVQKGHRGAA